MEKDFLLSVMLSGVNDDYTGIAYHVEDGPTGSWTGGVTGTASGSGSTCSEPICCGSRRRHRVVVPVTGAV